MTTHIVKQGECLSVIASRHGMSWKQLWDDPGNEKLRERRKDPNVLYPGDEVAIPEAKRSRVALTLDASTTVVRRRAGGTSPFTLKLLDASGKPLANTEYKFTVGSETRTGRTDKAGMLREELALDVDAAVVEFGGKRYELEIGHLNPLEETDDAGLSGAQARLKNLGYRIPAIDGKKNDATERALRKFQADEGLDVTGELDDATRARLRERHGC
jgi:hypothetical protein